MTRKPIKDTVKKKLFALSGNQCGFPNCTERVYNLDEDILLGEMCHINAVNPNGARYNPELPETEINSFENLLLLCPNHHSFIDKNPKKYSAISLHEMKANHENKFYAFAGIFNKNAEGIVAKNIEDLEAIEALLTPEENEASLPQKKKYFASKDYITRYMTSIRVGGEFSLESKTLLNILNDENRITILGVAGSGKSIELVNAAFEHSLEKSDLYPVKIRLNTLTNQNIEDLLELEYPDFKNIPKQKLLILLDALDEVHVDYLDIAVNNISLFSKKYHNSKIIVSCRNNFYVTETYKRRAKLEDFSTFLIKPLDYTAVHSYLLDKIDISPEIFIEDLRKKKIFDLLYSPFYLVNLVDYFNAKKEIPESKKTIFDYLILQRIEADFDKYENSGVSIQDYSIKIEPFIEQLAIIAESMGKNYLDEKTEVFPLIPDTHFLKIIKRTFLFNKTPKLKRWEFEHNNFQEFLAARFLSRLSIEKIKEFVSFKPGFKKIKPSWLNTLSFLFSIVESNEKLNKLIEWINNIEPDILIRFEKDKIDLEIREKLFKDIYEEFESKEIFIRNEKFESEDLVMFVSDSYVIIEYLIKKIIDSNNMLIISEALQMFPSFKHITNYKCEIRDVLLSKLSQVVLSDNIKYHCLNSLSELKIYDKKLTQEILKFNPLKGGKYIRSGFYKYLENSDQIDDYIDVLLKGIDLIQTPILRIKNDSEYTESTLSSEKHNLERLLHKIDSPKGVLRILEWAVTHEGNRSLDDIYFEQIKSVLKKATQLYLKDTKKVYYDVLNLLDVFSRKYYPELVDDFKCFFKETKTEFKAFIQLYKDFQIKLKEDPINIDYYGLTLVCNEEGIKHLICEIKKGRLVEPQTWIIRNYFSSGRNSEMFDLYHKELEKIDKEKYSIKKIDYNAIKKNRLKRDIELLFDKEEFLYEAKLIFEEEGKDKTKITFAELIDWKNKRLNDPEMSNQIIINTLREKAREKKYVELHEVEDLVNNEDRWKWFTLHKLVNFDKNNSHFKYNTEVTNYIHTWVNKEILNANFKTAITFIDDRYNFRYTELYISYFTQRLNIVLSEENYLDFLLVDCSFLPVKNIVKQNENDSKIPNTKTFLIEKLGKEKVVNQIIQNLETNEIIPIVKKNHFKYCQELSLSKATPIIFNEILNSDKDKFDPYQLITQYIELNGDYKELLDIIKKFSTEVQFHTLILLAERKFIPVIEYSKTQIDTEGKEETRLRYIQIIAKIKTDVAFYLLKKWVIKNKQLPDRIFDLSDLDCTKLNDLIEIVEDSLINNYGTNVFNSRNHYLVKLIELGSKNNEDYFKVKSKLNDWLVKYESMKFLHYQLQKLEQLYYSNKKQSLTFEEAKNLLSKKSITLRSNPLYDYKVQEIIDLDEGKEVEFKSSLRYCLKKKKPMDYVEHSLFKNIAAFLNTNGGVILVGVEDNRNVIGLDFTDYLTFNKEDKKDEFLKHFDNLFGKLLGNGYNNLVEISIEDVNGKKVAKINITKKASEPVFLNSKGKDEEFYIRRSASTIKLTSREILSYTREHWT